MFDLTKYQIVFQIPDVCKIYAPLNTADYHISRLQEAMRQNIYATNGMSSECLNEHLDAIIELCNQTGELKTIRTDIGNLANSLKTRMKLWVDPPSGLRLGAALSFIEYYETVNGEKKVICENPDKVEWYYSKKKEDLALEYPELYAFFLTWGGGNSTRSSEYLDILNDSAYLLDRTRKLLVTLPENLSRLSKI